MALKYVLGNLLDAEETVIVHGCNDQGVMGSGVAAAIRKKWPHVYEKYAERYAERPLQLGEVVWVVADNKTVIANAITQHLYGRSGDRFASYDAIDTAMRAVVAKVESSSPSISKSSTIAIPLIGAALGGGRWSVISRILEEIQHDTKAIFNVYVLDEVIFDYLSNTPDPVGFRPVG